MRFEKPLKTRAFVTFVCFVSFVPCVLWSRHWDNASRIAIARSRQPLTA